MDKALPAVLSELGVAAARVTTLKDLPSQNGSWLVETDGADAVVLRRYHDAASVAEIEYEHRLLIALGREGWVVPEPLGPPIEFDGLLYCLTRIVPGAARKSENGRERAQRGKDLARLDLAMHRLNDELGQRPRWRPLHTDLTVHEDIDWSLCLASFSRTAPRLAEWAESTAVAARVALEAVGAAELPLTMVHGDFAEWNVHYGADGALAGVVDFGLSHVDSRPYELAMARTYRCPETLNAYRHELRAIGWPLSELEEASLPAIQQAFRVDMVAWQLQSGRLRGAYDLEMIRRQLHLAGTPPP